LRPAKGDNLLLVSSDPTEFFIPPYVAPAWLRRCAPRHRRRRPGRDPRAHHGRISPRCTEDARRAGRL